MQKSKDISQFFSRSKQQQSGRGGGLRNTSKHGAETPACMTRLLRTAAADERTDRIGGGRRSCARIYTSVAPLLAGGRPDLGVAPVGPELGGAGPEHVLVVGGGDGGADQRAHPEDPLHKTTRADTDGQ
jgi:hypothetical protein